MITGELKNKIDGIWDIFWSSGMTNPLTVIEQITYQRLNLKRSPEEYRDKGIIISSMSVPL